MTSQPSQTSQTSLRVRYAETDQMGVVYHSNYLIWFEVGRAEHIRQMGLDYKSMEREEKTGIAVVEASLRYKAPARYDDLILVRTTLAHVRGSVLHFTYTVHRAQDDQLLCEGHTTHVVVGQDMKRAPMPPRYAEAFQKARVPVTEAATS